MPSDNQQQQLNYAGGVNVTGSGAGAALPPTGQMSTEQLV